MRARPPFLSVLLASTLSLALITPTGATATARSALASAARTHPVSITSTLQASQASGASCNKNTLSALNTECVDQLGSGSLAVAIQGSNAYLGDGKLLVVLNVSNPAGISIVGVSNSMPGNVNAVTVSTSSGYAYVADGSGGLIILDIHNPATPHQVGSLNLGGAVSDVAILGDYAYVAAGTGGLIVVDVSNPASPTRVASIAMTGSANGLTLATLGSTTYAYVAGGSSGLWIINITTPTSPVLTKNWSNGLNTYADIKVAIQGANTYAYVAAQKSGLRILDVTNPQSPSEIGSYVNPAGESAQRVDVSGTYAYLADGSFGMEVVNVTTPQAPILAAVNSTVGGQALGFANDVAIASVNGGPSYAYLASLNGLFVLNFQPNSLSLPGWYQTPGAAYNVAVSGDYAYVAAYDLGLLIVNAVNPATLSTAALFSTAPGLARDVVVSGSYAYIANDTAGLQIVNVSNPSAPSLAGSFAPNISGVAGGIAVSDATAYLADGAGGLQLINISNPASPVGIGSYVPSNPAVNDVAVSGNYAYLADANNGLIVLDISNPASPVVKSTYITSGASGLAFVGNTVYLADGSNGLLIFSVDSSGILTRIGSLLTAGTAYDVSVSGQYAYVACWDSGLQIVNVGNPSQPVLAGSYDTPGYSSAVAQMGNFTYVADRTDGLFILWFGPPSTVVLQSSPSGTVSGALTSSFDNTSYVFPVGTFTPTVGSVVVTHDPRYPGNLPMPVGNLVGIGHAFDISAVISGTNTSLQPQRSYSITVQFSQPLLGVAIENTLAFYQLSSDQQQWLPGPSSAINTTAETVTTSPGPNSFGIWQVLGQTLQTFMPVAFQQ